MLGEEPACKKQRKSKAQNEASERQKAADLIQSAMKMSVPASDVQRVFGAVRLELVV